MNRTIKVWVDVYLEGEAALGWTGKLHKHQRNAAGHNEGENHRYALAHLIDLSLTIDDDHPAAGRRTLFGKELRVGDLYPDELTPAVIWMYQARLKERGLTRGYINRCVGRMLGSLVKRTDSFFPWLVQRGAMSMVKLGELRCVSNVRQGEPGVEEAERVLAVPMKDFVAAMRCADKQLHEMMRVQYHGCMRPGELLAMRPCDITRDPSDPDIWAYHPPCHKTAHRGHTRRIPLGSEAQTYICENNTRLWGEPSLFSGSDMPRLGDPDDVRWIWADIEKSKSPRFKTEKSYTKAIKRAALRAQVPTFTANQIRKRALTDAAERQGAEVAAEVGGHRDMRTTKKHYIDPNHKAADDYARKYG